MSNIEDDTGIGDFPPIVTVRRSTRLSDQMAQKDGGSARIIDLTSDGEGDNVPDDIRAGDRQGSSGRQTRRVLVNVGSRRKRLGIKAKVPTIMKKEIDDTVGVVKKVAVKKDKDDKRHMGKKSKYYIVAEDQGVGDMKGKKVGKKTRLMEGNMKGKKAVVGEEQVDADKGGEGHLKKKSTITHKVIDADRVHVRVSLCSLHRLIPNLSPKQKQDVTDMGFGSVLGFKIKDVPTKLGFWLLENFNEDTCVLDVDGKQICITKETIRDVLGLPMGCVAVESRDETDFRHPLVVEWKRQFGKQGRYKHIPVEKQIYTQAEGGWMFKLNFLVLYFTSIGEANMNATVNLRFMSCISDENDIPLFDWCTFVLECLVRTKKNWVRKSHYCGPVIVLLIVYANWIKQRTGNGQAETPLVNNWTGDQLNKLEEDRFNPKNVEEVKNSVLAKYKKVGELISKGDEALDEALEQCPHDEQLLEMKELRDVLFGARKYHPAEESTKANGEGDNEECGTPENDVPKPFSYNCETDEPFPFTQFYGTPSAIIACIEEVELQRSNEEKRQRSDNVIISSFDLNQSQPPATQGRTVGDDDGLEEGQKLLDFLPLYDSQDLPHFECFTPERLIVVNDSNTKSSSAISEYTICDAKPLQTVTPEDEDMTKRFKRPAEVLCSPYVQRSVCLASGLSTHEKRVSDCLFSGRFSETDILFRTAYAYGPRTVFESLCPGIKIASGVIDIFTKVLNYAEKFRDPRKQMRKVFWDTSLLHEWDGIDATAKKEDVMEASNKFNKNMASIMQRTEYRTLNTVDLVFFPVIQEGHFFVVCMHLRLKEVQILDNMLSAEEDVAKRYGEVIEFLVARFEDFLAIENHPARGLMRIAVRKILRLGCMTKANFIDYGVFVMRHMETYLGGGEYDDLCGLRREGPAQKLQLAELRKKYAAKILLCDINQKKPDFEVEAEAYKMLPPEEKERLDASSFETIKARVTSML